MASQFLIPEYNLPRVLPQGQIPSEQVATPALAFGPDGSQLQQAGARLDQAGNTVQNIFDKEAALANQARVEEGVNQFVAESQKMLYSDPDAFYRKQGQDAITGAQVTTDRLQALKEQLLGGMSNPVQKQALATRLDSQINSATAGMSRHVTIQSMTWQKQVAAGRQQMNQLKASNQYNDDDLLDSAASDAAQGAIQQAHVEGHTNPDGSVNMADPYVQAQILAAKGGVYKTAILQRIAHGDLRSASALYERVKDQVGLKADLSLATQMKGIRTQVNGQDIANDALSKQGAPPIPGSDGGPRENNIGNLRPVGANTGFQSFQTFDEGVTAAVQNLRKYPASFNGGKPMTLTQIGQHWAPAGDGNNDPTQWAKNVGATAGIDPNTPVDLSNPQIAAKVARGIHAAEWGTSNIKDVSAYLPGANAAFGGPNPQGGTGPAFKGDISAAYRAASDDISTRTDISPAERTAALTILNKQRTAITGYQTAAVKSLTDEVNSTLAVAFANPSSLKPNTLAGFADRAAALGEQELATKYRYLASMEGTIRNGILNAPQDQRKLLGSILDGLPKQIIEVIKSGNGDAVAAADNSFAKLRQAQSDGLDPAGLTKMATDTINLYTAAGKGTKAQEVQEFLGAALGAGKAAKLPPAQQQQAMNELSDTVAKGQATEQQLELYHMLKAGFAHQQEAFSKDAYSAGTSLYPQVGQPVALDWNATDPATLDQQLAMRTKQAQQIDALRGTNNTLPFSQPELHQLRASLDAAGPDRQAAIFRSLSRLPAEMVPRVVSALAGKNDTGDPLSRSYAAALGLYADHDPDHDAVADQVLKGAQIMKGGGAEGKTPVPTSPGWKAELQNRMGNVLKDMPKAAPMVEDAIAAVYTYQMTQAGKQGAPLDTGVLDSAIDTVLGKPITRNGQAIMVPKGVNTYQFDGALHTLTDGDLGGAKTLEGDPVSADVVYRRGVLSSVGNGRYLVRIPDPRAGGDLRPFRDPATGQNFVLDIRPLLQRAGGNLSAPPDELPNPLAGVR
jgi:hypothetical protein